MQRDEQSPTVLASTDQRLIELTQASAAASGVSLIVSAQLDELRILWRSAGAILIGADQAEQVVRWGLPSRDEVYLVGHQADEALCQWSVPLGATVIVLPGGAKWLSRVLAGRDGRVDTGTAVAIRAGAGGVGASTLCAGLACLAARRLKVAVVDCDSLGGGADLLLGAEDTPGWRWGKLRHASGHIADVTAMLPQTNGVTLVSMERDDPQPIPETACEAVVDCLTRSHDLVLVDMGRSGPRIEATFNRSLHLSTLAVRAIAATRVSLAGQGSGHSGLVLRKGGAVTVSDAARAIDLPLVGVVPQVRDLARLADQGVPPLLGGGWRKACSAILNWCLDQPAGTRW